MWRPVVTRTQRGRPPAPRSPQGPVEQPIRGGPAGPAEQTTDYSDWRPVDGIAFSFKRTIKRNGEDAGSVELSEVKVDPAVDPTAFDKPTSNP